MNLYRRPRSCAGFFRSLGQEADSRWERVRAGPRTKVEVLSPYPHSARCWVQGATPNEITGSLAKGDSPTAWTRAQHPLRRSLARVHRPDTRTWATWLPVMAGLTLSFKMGREPCRLVYVCDGATLDRRVSRGQSIRRGIEVSPRCRREKQRLCVLDSTQPNDPPPGNSSTRRSAMESADRQADGNDVIAAYEVTKRAFDRARAGGWCHARELITYRRKVTLSTNNQSYVAPVENRPRGK